MKIFAFLALYLVSVAAQQKYTTLKDLRAKGEDTRIINGYEAREGQFPWQVALDVIIGGNGFFCGGGLIDPQWVLTAAHCADGASSFNLKFGSVNVTGAVSVPSSEYFVHPEYDAYLHNDIALIKLSSPIELTETIDTITLGKRRIGKWEYVRVSGWGANAYGEYPYKLQYVDLLTISNDDCYDVFGSTIQNNTLCCENRGQAPCSGDSGGPVIQVIDNVPTHVAIVSFAHHTGCNTGYPNGYTRTESMLDWINEIMTTYSN